MGPAPVIDVFVKPFAKGNGSGRSEEVDGLDKVGSQAVETRANRVVEAHDGPLVAVGDERRREIVDACSRAERRSRLPESGYAVASASRESCW